MKKLKPSLKEFLDKKSKRNKIRNKKFIPNTRLLFLHQNIHEELLLIQNNARNEDKILKAPENFCFVDNTEECLLFFQNARDSNYIINYGKKKYIQFDLKKVSKIDYGTICVLKAILYEMEHNNIDVRGSFPENIECRKFISDSGFLSLLVDEKGRKFRKVKKSEIVFFQKSDDEFSDEEMRKLGDKIKMIMAHFTGVEKHNQSLRSVILEICGNSIEHSESLNNHWVIGFHFSADKVEITITDIGRGILETLFRKFGQKIMELLTIRNDLNVLKGAFIRKYGSRTLEENRNKGLPMIMKTNEDNRIQNLVVITNNVILRFNDEDSSRIFQKDLKFFGTFYQWEINRSCLF